MDLVDQDRNGETVIDSVALLDVLLKVMQHVRVQMNDWLSQFELNDGRYGVLSALSNATDGGLSQADLADLLGQSASNVSTLIERMARDGLVIRIQSRTDRRKRMWSMSPDGQTRFESVEARRAVWSARLFKSMSSREQHTLFGLMQRFEVHAADSETLSTSSVTPPAIKVFDPTESERPLDPAADPGSPQFALQQMLAALSSCSEVEPRTEREAA